MSCSFRLYLVLAVLYLVVAAIEVIGIFAVYRSSIRFVRYYFYASAVGKHSHLRLTRTPVSEPATHPHSPSHPTPCLSSARLCVPHPRPLTSRPWLHSTILTLQLP